MTFEELNLAPAIVKAVLEQGYENPTPIQAQAIPAVLTGKDLLAGAQTGTGKTAAFSLPMLHRLTQGGTAAPAGGIRALILTPTRELAAQIEENIRGYSKYLDVTSTVIFGGGWCVNLFEFGVLHQIKLFDFGWYGCIANGEFAIIRTMRRKIYQKLLQWKEISNGHSAVLIDGARRVGKSWIAEEFAKNEYEKYLLIDFSKVPKDVKGFFEDYLEKPDLFFM